MALGLNVPYTPIAETEVIVHPTTGASSFAVIDTDSYLSMNLHSQMQNAAPYIGWSLDKWIQAITADAQQRCAAYPESCAGTTPEQLGVKWGMISFNLMQGVSLPASVPVTTPQSTPVQQTVVPGTITIQQTGIPHPSGALPTIQETQNGITSGMLPNPVTGVYIQTTGTGDYSVPGIPDPSINPDYITQKNASVGAVSDNQSQSTLANSGGNPVAPVVPAGTFVLPTSLAFLGNTVAIAGYNIPIWMIGAGAIAAYMLSQGNGQGRRGKF